MLGTKALDDYVASLKRGTDPLLAFRDLVGNPLPAFEKEFGHYLRTPAVGRDGGQVIDSRSQTPGDLIGFLNEPFPSDSLGPCRGRSVGSRIEGGCTHMMRKRKLRTAAKRRRKAINAPSPKGLRLKARREKRAKDRR